MDKQFQNTTIFYAPVWFDDYKTFVAALRGDARYVEEGREILPQYLLPYAVRIAKNAALFTAFELQTAHLPALSMYESYRPASAKAALSRVRMTCFATGCGFMEFYVTYDGLTAEQICDFTFHFKKATKTNGANGKTMYDAIHDLLPHTPPLDIFFTGTDFKRECRVFHQLLVDLPAVADDLQETLVRLRRGYHKGFLIPTDDSTYDMLYEPYPYDHWAGSQEGLVSLSHESGNHSADSYLYNHKQKQLMENYRFMYLLLLNQRFSAICYIRMIAESEQAPRRERQELSRRIAKLKTVFAFNVISDDQLYQNIYSRMYVILDIDRLLDDIHDNEAEADLLYKAESAEAEDMTSKFLLGLSILSLFSTLVDAAGFFERFTTIRPFATGLSIGCTLTIFVVMIVWWVVHRRR